jgi:glycosyltransferase involved in cell wall biosynthesis
LIHNEKNIGLTKSLNKGIGKAKGKYIARMDADDVSLPKRFERQVEALDKNPEIVLVFGCISFINVYGSEIGKRTLNKDPNILSWHLLFYNCIIGHSVAMFRREPILRLGGYSENRKYSQDYALWSRLAENSDILILPDVLLKYRKHDENITTQCSSEQHKCSLLNSQFNIARLIGAELSLSRVEELRNFWLNKYPFSRSAAFLNSELKHIYKAYIDRYEKRRRLSVSDIPLQLRILVGKKFLSWSCNIQDSFYSRIKLSLYAFTWHPSGVLRFWLREIRKRCYSQIFSQ